jgi:hypothetical protein
LETQAKVYSQKSREAVRGRRGHTDEDVMENIGMRKERNLSTRERYGKEEGKGGERMEKRKKEGEVKAGDLMFLWAWRDETFHGDPATSTPSPPLLVTSCSSAFHSLPAFSLACESPLAFSCPASLGPRSHYPASLSSIKSKFQPSR